MEENLAGKQWYVVNTMSGHENKVKANLERRIETMNMQEYIYQVLVAEEEVPVMKEGLPTGKTRIKNTYPGYVFVEMIMTDEAWFVVRNTPGVTGFVGSSGKGTKPFPVPKAQIDTVLKKVGIVNKDMYAEYLVGTEVRVLRGPLEGSTGVITNVDAERDLVTVNVTFFGRVTTLELDFADIEKVAQGIPKSIYLSGEIVKSSNHCFFYVAFIKSKKRLKSLICASILPPLYVNI